MASLAGKTCVITGAGGHIGRVLVERFKEADATVIATDRVHLDIEGVDCVVCDLGDPHSILALERHLSEHYGSVDCLINNGAVGGGRSLLHEKTLEEYEMVMNVNVRGPWLLSQSAIRLHLDAAEKHDSRKELHIINIASLAAHKPVPLGSFYSASKAALVSLTKSITKEYAGKRVRCNSVSPGYMDIPNVQGFDEKTISDLQRNVPSGRAGLPIEIANVCAWLASDQASYVNGADMLVDGGALS